MSVKESGNALLNSWSIVPTRLSLLAGLLVVILTTNGLASPVIDIFDGDTISNLATSDHEIINIYGGNVFNIATCSQETINMFGGFVNNIAACNQESINIMGGELNCLVTPGNSVVSISGGKVGSFYPGTTGTASISAGEVDYIWSDWSGTLNITGGIIGSVYSADSSTVNIYTKSFVLDGGLSMVGTSLYGSGLLSGTWDNGLSFSMDVTKWSTSSTINVIGVPEPMTILLLGLGGVFLRRRKF